MTSQTSQSFFTTFDDENITLTFQGSEIEFLQGMMVFPVFEMTLFWNTINEFHGMYDTSKKRSNAQQYRRINQ